MAISFISGEGANADNVTLGTHASGDILIAFAGLEGSATPPSLPAGWTNVVATASPDNVASRIGYKIAASSSETSGTWTNAQSLIVLVYRGQHASGPIGANSEDSGGGTTVNYPALTLNVTDSTSWVILFCVHSWGTGTLGTPTGATARSVPAGPGGGVMVGSWDSNAGVASWSATTGTAPGYDDYQTRALELIADAGGGGGTQQLFFMIGDLSGIGSPGRFFKDVLQ